MREGGRILLGDDTGGEAVMLLPIRLHCVGFWIELNFLVYTRVVGLRRVNSELNRILLLPDHPGCSLLREWLSVCNSTNLTHFRYIRYCVEIWRGEKFLTLEEERAFSYLEIVQISGSFPGGKATGT